MDMISDILLAAGALAASFYCVVLSQHLRRFTDLEKGVGGAVAVLSAQVDDLTKTLAAAQKTAQHSTGSLGASTRKAEDAARRLELLVASLHDLPDSPPAAAPPRPAAKPASPSPYFMRKPETAGAL